jgi:hypothetical protein
VVGLGHSIDVSRVGKAEDLVPVGLCAAVNKDFWLARTLRMPTLSIELCRTSCTAAGSLMLTSL